MNRYLLDFASIEGQRQKHYRLRSLLQTIELTVDDAKEDVDLTLLENRSYQEADFLNLCFERTAKSTFKDFQSLSFFMREDSFLV